MLVTWPKHMRVCPAPAWASHLHREGGWAKQMTRPRACRYGHDGEAEVAEGSAREAAAKLSLYSGGTRLSMLSGTMVERGMSDTVFTSAPERLRA